jgi:hypothetical protein
MATIIARPLPVRRGCVASLLLLAPILAGCEAMDRMDFFDQFFEPASRPGPVVAMQPIVSSGDYGPATDRVAQPTLVRAMEPIANPADYHPTAENRAPLPASHRTSDPRPNPVPPSEADAESRTRLLVRQNFWVTRFWMELTPAQQSRVQRQLHRSNLLLTGGGTDAAAEWDRMGLADRVGLVFGKTPSGPRPEPMKSREDLAVSDRS